MHLSTNDKARLLSEAIKTYTARLCGCGCHKDLPTYKELAEKYDVWVGMSKQLAEKVLNGGDILRKHGSGQFSTLDKTFKRKLDQYLISVNGHVTMDQER